MESCLIIGKRVLLFARTSPAHFMFLPLVRMYNNVEWNQPIGLYILQLGQQQSANQTAGYHILETSGGLPRSRHSISSKVGRSASHDNDTWCMGLIA